MKRRIDVMDLVLLIGSAVFLIGSLSFLHPCVPEGDSGYMSCHWAGQMLKGLAGVLTLLSLLHLFMPVMTKAGLDMGILAVSALTLLTPGRLIALCMMPEMRCRSVMAPGALVFATVLLAAAVIDLVMQTHRALLERKRRKKELQSLEQAAKQAEEPEV